MIEPELTRRRRGQTLAEFAITLPILLILIFGIIEFGRIFQAWVTLQNAARAAARYATTGGYDEDRYLLDLEYRLIEGDNGDLNSIVPCLRDELAGDDNGNGRIDGAEVVSEEDVVLARRHNLAQRGVLTTIYPNDTSGSNANNAVQIYVGGPESLYATWYGGDDCDPQDPVDQNRRKDMARILSIYDEARRDAAGLALGSQVPPEPVVGLSDGITSNPLTWAPTSAAALNYPNPANVPWYQVWYRPLPGDHDSDPGTPERYFELEHSDEPGWFSMMICSTRGKLDNTNLPSAGNPDERFETRITTG